MNGMMMQQLAQQIDIQSTPAPVVARQVAERERRMADTLAQLAEATGVDIDPVTVDVERRTALLLEAAEAIISQNVAGWWWETIGPNIVDRPDLAENHTGLTADEWHDRIRGWYQGLYQKDRVDKPVEQAGPAEIGAAADRYVRSLFGVSLREFVAVVVNWTPQAAVQDILAGPTDEMMRQFEVIVEHVEA
jgi:hypothetical protein